jgi:L-threonylcarbamoyladenylate synthase
MQAFSKKTEIIRVNKISNDAAADRAAEVLLSGGIIGFPTETVYGLGADALNKKAIDNLYLVKRRTANKPTTILIALKKDIHVFAKDIPPKAESLINNFWPGPLTIIFKASNNAPESVTGGTGTIGIRIPADDFCLSILKKAEIPVAAPSANPNGMTPAVTAWEVIDYFSGKIDLILNGGESKGKAPSTVIDLTNKNISVLREGAIKKEDILSAAGD